MTRMIERATDKPRADRRNLPLHELLDGKAVTTPHALAFRFLPDGGTREETLTYGELATRARAIAAGLVHRGATGQPVLLVEPPGLDFIIGLFACWYAGTIAVPCYPPRGSRHRTRLAGILQDCDARFAVAPEAMEMPPGVTIVRDLGPAEMTFAPVDPAAPCLLQYTSGSTAAPKGVVISHDNFRSHFAALKALEVLDLKSVLSWLPPYHDMGLVLKILYPFEAGIPLTFFPPEHFIQRPIRWLRAISRFRASLSGAPNFAYEMCLRSIRDDELEGLDLSCWKAASCGAERVLPDTLRRFAKRFEPYGFRPESIIPGYGLAEATLIVSASPNAVIPRQIGALVSSGAPLPGVDVRIVDPATGLPCPDRQIGEIRVAGSTISAGYWKRPEFTAEAFSPELRTGDLGFLDGGELFVTGRLKDSIIIDGANFAAEDIESAILMGLPEITTAAAFSSSDGERETITVALEGGSDFAAIRAAVRRTIGDALEIPIARIVFIRTGLLPRTTSGKIRRSACRAALEDGSLRLLSDEETPVSSAAASPALRTVLEAIHEITSRPGATAGDDLLSFGLRSMEITRLASALRRETGVALSIGDLFAARSIAEIAVRIESGEKVAAEIPGESDPSAMTWSQERMWFLHQLDPQSAAYHVFGAVELLGSLDIPALETAARHVISRHEILRSRHGIEDGRARVWIEDNIEISLARSAAATESELQKLLTSFAQKPFVLADESPIRIALLACGPSRHVLAICAHHIVADGWSLRLLAGEIAATYGGQAIASPENYFTHAAWHRRWIDSGAVDSQIAYWKTKLADHPGVIRLPTDFPNPPVPSAAGDFVEMDLSADLSNRVAIIARAHRATPFMVHLATFLLLLRGHGAGDDLVVAVPVANRNHPGTADLVGTLVNTLPFRLELDGQESFSELLGRVRLAALEMQAAQDAPFEKIIEVVKPGRSRDRSPLAQVMFDYQEIPVAETWAGGLECRPFTAHRGAVQFDLNLLLKSLSDRQRLSLEFRSDLFRPESAAAFLARYATVLEQACAVPAEPAAAISPLTAEDRAWLAATSTGPNRPRFAEKTTPALIAARDPQRTAVVSGNVAIDYATLDSRSTELAAALRARGVGPGDRLGILLERDENLPIALLAAWKTGAAYVPLDAANPPERLALILADQQPFHVLVAPSLADRLPQNAATIVFDETLRTPTAEFLPHPTAPSDPAYIIYTSGSTGKPKGVVVPHGALANFLLSMAEAPGFTAADRLLAVTTVSFDISLLEIFLPLIMGGTVDIVPAEVAKDGTALLERLGKSRPTVLQATPATWRMLIDAGWQGSPDLKILCGGEALDLPLARQLRPRGCELWNLYGPTETTVWSTIWQVPNQPTEISVGRPIANTGIHLLNSDGAPVPPGVPGTLWISGDGLATGYWQRPDLTDAAFAPLADGRRGYATGDLARWRTDGTLECLGRSDNQVKIRGFRVELGEIEAALAAHPAVRHAKVDFRGPDPTTRKVVAWVVLAAGNAQSRTAVPAVSEGGRPACRNPNLPPTSQVPLDSHIADLRKFLSTTLPAYMLPTDIGVIDAFPLNASGKVDVSKLPSPAPVPPDDEPLTEMEQKLAAIWAELLDRPAIAKRDDWFHIGGHSLLALRLFARIHRELHRRLPLSAILEHPTLAGLAAAIEKSPVES